MPVCRYVSQIVSQRILDDYNVGDFVSKEILQATEGALQVDLSSVRNSADERQKILDALAAIEKACEEAESGDPIHSA